MVMRCLLAILTLGLTMSITACTELVSPNPIEVRISLSEYKFTSSLTEFERGKSYSLAMTNEGKAPHELLILSLGDTDKNHAILNVGKEKLPKGSKTTVVFSIGEQVAPGDYEFACHVGHHYEEGMMLKIKIK
jgi:uncharacterized cupredoxin-like copper-binding protein